MNREIKFRAWDGREMIIIKSAEHLLSFGGDFYTLDNVNGVTYYKNEEWVLMQYTGLKDKNGKEIWEGDILLWESFDEEELKEIYIVIWESPCFVVRVNGKDIPSEELDSDFEVIGNIYENSELLTKEDE